MRMIHVVAVVNALPVAVVAPVVVVACLQVNASALIADVQAEGAVPSVNERISGTYSVSSIVSIDSIVFLIVSAVAVPGMRLSDEVH